MPRKTVAESFYSAYQLLYIFDGCLFEPFVRLLRERLKRRSDCGVCKLHGGIDRFVFKFGIRHFKVDKRGFQISCKRNLFRKLCRSRANERIDRLGRASDRGNKPVGYVKSRFDRLERLYQLFDPVDLAYKLIETVFHELGLEHDVYRKLNNDLIAGIKFGHKFAYVRVLFHVYLFFDLAVGVIGNATLFDSGDIMAYVIKRDIGYIREGNFYRVILGVISRARNLEIKVQCVARPYLESIFRLENVVYFFLEGHHHALKACGYFIAAGFIAADIPVSGRCFALRNVFKLFFESLLLALHCCKRQSVGKLQFRGKIFKRIGFGVVYNEHLDIEHLLEPSDLASDNQVEILRHGIDIYHFSGFLILRAEVSLAAAVAVPCAAVARAAQAA